MHGLAMGLKPKTIIATGGASANRTITQVSLQPEGTMVLVLPLRWRGAAVSHSPILVWQIMSNVFGIPVRIAEQPDSASLGAAYRAFHASKCAAAGSFIPFEEVLPTLGQDYETVRFSRRLLPDARVPSACRVCVCV